jgi:mitogen-activated protein kinase kinase kinase
VELPSHDVQGEQRKQSMLIALQREIALLRDLTHENIVHYIGNASPITLSPTPHTLVLWLTCI